MKTNNNRLRKLQFSKWLDGAQSKVHHVEQELELGFGCWLALSAWNPMWRMMQKTLWNHLERVPQLDKMSTVTLLLGRGNNRLGISY